MSERPGSAFAGKVVLVTGASSGIGAELARQLAASGARVALVARDLTRLEAVADECRALGGNTRRSNAGRGNGRSDNAAGDALAVQADVSDERSCAAAVEQTVAHFGALDILVNNAGLSAHGRFDEITDLTIFERLTGVNYLGSVWCTAHALPHIKRARGQIVAISSLTALTGVPTRAAYGATKRAMAGFFDALRVELQNTGVSVTTIYPGWVQTEMSQRALSGDGTPSGERGSGQRDKMTVEECCRLILRAIADRDRELLMTWRGKVGRLMMLLSPRLVDRFAARAVRNR